MEWYHSATIIVPIDASISADVGPVFEESADFLDFYVNNELCWNVKLIRIIQNKQENLNKTSSTYSIKITIKVSLSNAVTFFSSFSCKANYCKKFLIMNSDNEHECNDEHENNDKNDKHEGYHGHEHDKNDNYKDHHNYKHNNDSNNNEQKDEEDNISIESSETINSTQTSNTHHPVFANITNTALLITTGHETLRELAHQDL
ncbi:hypothetical protein C1645_739213 [Glomus cerebriforme]|uniref:Uncharacterized protein n=1 Tax=Glomus cerebriforme TaxID=658196 RepID=A0A397SUU8_9GLOM|nr:hypothetical protein C1645_739213 [Glomus cerebriforme]